MNSRSSCMLCKANPRSSLTVKSPDPDTMSFQRVMICDYVPVAQCKVNNCGIIHLDPSRAAVISAQIARATQLNAYHADL